jgi:hypothetical protein
MRKLNIIIITLTIASLTIETVRGNYPWELKTDVIFFKTSEANASTSYQNTSHHCLKVRTPDTLKN